MQSYVGNHAVEEQLFNMAHETELGRLYMEARAFTNGLVAEGFEKDVLLDIYEAVADRLYDEKLDEEAEELLEVMAELEGWCANNLAI